MASTVFQISSSICLFADDCILDQTIISNLMSVGKWSCIGLKEGPRHV